MIKLFKSVCLSILLSLSSASALALEFTCPSLDALKAHGVTNVKYVWGWYIGCETSSFGTDRTWSLIIDSIEADSDEMAIINGNKLLNSLTQSPELYTDDAEVICYYKRPLDGVLIAATLTDHFCDRV